MAAHNLLTQSSTTVEDDDEEEEEEEETTHHPDHNHRDEEMGTSRKSQRNSMDTSMASIGGCICSDDPIGKLDQLHEMADKMKDETDGAGANCEELSGSSEDDDNNKDARSTKTKKNKNKKMSKKEKKRLSMMSLKTAVAIALHNFPEGLATFVATMQDPAVGIVLAIAIAIHNIPEGLCVSLPVYYATGNRWKAFSWGLLSGVSEPLAALLGWLVLASFFNDMIYGILFGVVAGMMVLIAVKELLPTAHRYDPTDSVVTNSFITGMAVMAMSLVLFKFL